MKASDLPLSILIIGVGGADFRQMEVGICVYIHIFIDVFCFNVHNLFLFLFLIDP